MSGTWLIFEIVKFPFEKQSNYHIQTHYDIKKTLSSNKFYEIHKYTKPRKQIHISLAVHDFSVYIYICMYVKFKELAN